MTRKLKNTATKLSEKEILIELATELLTAVGYPFNLLESEVKGGKAWAKRAPKVLLTLAGIGPDGSLARAIAWNVKGNLRPNKKWIAQYNLWWGHDDVSKGTYDYFLRNGLRPLIDTGLAVEDPDVKALRKPNSPAKAYGLSIPAEKLLRVFDSKIRSSAVIEFLDAAALARAAYINTQAAQKLRKH